MRFIDQLLEFAYQLTWSVCGSLALLACVLPGRSQDGSPTASRAASSAVAPGATGAPPAAVRHHATR